ncbi:melanocortin receptor 4-like [Stylophora pistillata]|uniref:melanocortin receptor 4-like n=1 Tax=Stylophora pistillata TaxID=50429 RepID=UPI000C04A352|nr:melanocortin receptor 4-like [Stylophora pistillata]
MTLDTSDNTHNNVSHEVWRRAPASQCIPWLVVTSIESLAIIFLNVVTIIVFVKQRRLQRGSTFLIIHLAVVDLLVGVAGPAWIARLGDTWCNLWGDNSSTDEESWIRIQKVFESIFLFVSLFNLSVISLERVHATFFPFRHRFVKNWVYGLLIAVIWVVPLALRGAQIGSRMGRNSSFDFDFIMLLSYFAVQLSVICLSYISIYVKVRFSRHPQQHGAAGVRERKLTSTLFLVTVASLLTILPTIIRLSIIVFDFQFFTSLSKRSAMDFLLITVAFLLTNSLINPVIYAIRMPDLRAGILRIIFRTSSKRPRKDVLPLQNI